MCTLFIVHKDMKSLHENINIVVAIPISYNIATCQPLCTSLDTDAHSNVYMNIKNLNCIKPNYVPASTAMQYLSCTVTAKFNNR